jgi:carboxyl-terminal processing protease
MRTTWASPILVMLLLEGCGGSTSPTAPGGPSAPFNTTTYLSAMIDIMQNHSINRHTIDWTSFRSTVLSAAAQAKTVTDTFPAIRVALGLLGDHHSLYISATGGEVLNPSLPACVGSAFQQFPLVPATIGYVYVATCNNGCAPAAYAAALQNRIRTADNANIVGWIVDVRSNGGGFFSGMLVGVGPILGDGIAGYFIDADEQATSWGYSNGAETYGGLIQQPVIPAYSLLHPNPPVAVLLDNLTASSGEATAVSFLGRPVTRTFGTATCGLSTGNSTYALSDGASLDLTIAIDADRMMRRYGGQIIPDESIADPFQVLERAVAWIQGQADQGPALNRGVRYRPGLR